MVEVADITIEAILKARTLRERAIKIPLYASIGISEVWLIDVNEQVIKVFREPTNNSYQSIQELQLGEIFIQAFPDVSFAVEQIVG